MVTHVPQGTVGLAPSAPAVGDELAKAPTGVAGLDEVTGGGLPRGRPTLVCGPAGCGKTLLGMEFLVRGITDFGEPGVFLSFEESVDELVQNVASLGFDVQQLQDDGLLVMDNVALVHGDLEEAGAWDLDGLFIRLGAAIDEVGATRVVLDTIETLFGVFTDASLLRSELRRLFSWLKARGVTAVITGERGEGALTRHGIEEYVSDCVIVLDHRVSDQMSTRRLRILKYRGSLHGTNEYPYLIGRRGDDGVADHLTGPPAHRVERAGVEWGAGARHHARRRCLPWQLGSLQRHRRHREVHPGGAVLRGRLRSR